jgi:NADH-quinone oxidoreductase subunit I
MGIKKVRVQENWSNQIYLIDIFKGLRLTLSHFFSNLFGSKKTVTIQYPEQKRPVAERWRGRHRLTRHENGFIKCVACYMCETVCPANCIHIESEEIFDKSVEKYPTVFNIDELRCVFCGLCVEACPKDAIRMDTGIISMAYNNRKEFDFVRNLLLDEPLEKGNYIKYHTVPLPQSP